MDSSALTTIPFNHGKMTFIQRHSDQAISNLHSNNDLSWLKMTWEGKNFSSKLFCWNKSAFQSRCLFDKMRNFNWKRATLNQKPDQAGEDFAFHLKPSQNGRFALFCHGILLSTGKCFPASSIHSDWVTPPVTPCLRHSIPRSPQCALALGWGSAQPQTASH